MEFERKKKRIKRLNIWQERKALKTKKDRKKEREKGGL